MAPVGDQREVPWSEAVTIAHDVFAALGDGPGALARELTASGLIDAEPRTGKSAGVYCAPLPQGFPSLIQLTYRGQPGDAFTLAHELGHAVHFELAKAAHPWLTVERSSSMAVVEIPSTTSEIAAVEHAIAISAEADRGAPAARLHREHYRPGIRDRRAVPVRAGRRRAARRRHVVDRRPAGRAVARPRRAVLRVGRRTRRLDRAGRTRTARASTTTSTRSRSCAASASPRCAAPTRRASAPGMPRCCAQAARCRPPDCSRSAASTWPIRACGSWAWTRSTASAARPGSRLRRPVLGIALLAVGLGRQLPVQRDRAARAGPRHDRLVAGHARRADVWPLAILSGATGASVSYLEPLVVTGIVQITIPITLITVGQQWITSSLAGVLNGSVPIFVALFALVLDRSRSARPACASWASRSASSGVVARLRAGRRHRPLRAARRRSA